MPHINANFDSVHGVAFMAVFRARRTRFPNFHPQNATINREAFCAMLTNACSHRLSSIGGLRKFGE